MGRVRLGRTAAGACHTAKEETNQETKRQSKTTTQHKALLLRAEWLKQMARADLAPDGRAHQDGSQHVGDPPLLLRVVLGFMGHFKYLNILGNIFCLCSGNGPVSQMFFFYINKLIFTKLNKK